MCGSCMKNNDVHTPVANSTTLFGNGIQLLLLSLVLWIPSLPTLGKVCFFSIGR